MPAISKFLFAEEFVEPGIGPDGAPMPVMLRSKPKQYTEIEFETAKQAAYDEGRQTGYDTGYKTGYETARDETLASAEYLAAQAVAALQDSLPQALAKAERARVEADAGAVTAMGAIARKLLPALAAAHGVDEIEALARESIERLIEQPRFVVKVSPVVQQIVLARIEAMAETLGFAGRIVVLPDAAMPETDARIEWANGGVERNVADVWKEIEDAIERYLAMQPGATSAN
jgi:flagellar assembly protein FliH